MNFDVFEYDESMRKELEVFRRQAISEGNTSIVSDKFNPEAIHGKIWGVRIDGELASISVAEKSHYTGDPDVAVRICRYHILKKYRHSHCGFRMLPYQIEWAEKQGFKILYWTHDITNRPLNAMYQHKRKMVDKDAKQFFEADWYNRLQTDYKMLFVVDHRNPEFLQYVYYIDLQNENYDWKPKSNILWVSHDGSIKHENLKEEIDAYRKEFLL